MAKTRDEIDNDIADMEKHSDKVGQDIDEARTGWEKAVADDDVPGAQGDADAARSEDEAERLGRE